MKKFLLLLMTAIAMATVSCSKSDSNQPDTPRTNVPAAIQGNWMNGNFSVTEYWNDYPGDYLGNGFEVAFAFTFNADGTFTQYFSSAYVVNGVQNYQQSVSKGTVEIDAANQILKTHTTTVHYRRYNGRQMAEDRNLNSSEYDPTDVYNYTLSNETNGSDILNLTISGSENSTRPFRRL